ncbi:MAG: hypothetical protein HY548_01015, partial [Elusimicrobia bacterium]|nr:hypothetical protein [Elusimicrobiota bacterium]
MAAEGVTPVLASYVLERAEAFGFVHRVQAGYKSYAELVDVKSLLHAWVNSYRFMDHRLVTFQYRGSDFLPSLQQTLKTQGVQFALTLYSASRRIAPYVKNTQEFVCLNASKAEARNILDETAMRMGLVPAEQGWNVCFFVPDYRTCIFKNPRLLGEFPAVDNLQLYLDLTGYPPVGYEEA